MDQLPAFYNLIFVEMFDQTKDFIPLFFCCVTIVEELPEEGWKMTPIIGF